MSPAPLNALKQEAAALASSLGSVTTRARAASAAHLGSASRRRSGSGENFWQYRRHTMEDGAERIDWRRSAREENLFVRETELETSRTFLFWIDPSEGFTWSSDVKTPEKADRALVLSMALAGALSRAGERCGVLGGGRPPVSGARAPSRVGEDTRSQTKSATFPNPPRDTAAVVIASDFYEAPEVWRKRILSLSGKCRDGALLQVVDPAEETFPFAGRVRFSRPGIEAERIIGRSESIRDAYLERFAQRRRDLVEIASEAGWRVVTHVTSEMPTRPLSDLAHAFASAGIER